MNERFAKEMEDRDWEKLLVFNEKLHLDELARMNEKHYIDASGLTSTFDQVGIELKDRNMNLVMQVDGYALSGCTKEGNSYACDTLYIEHHKAADLLMDYVVEGRVPLYINFINDDVVLVYNLSKLSRRPQTTGKKKKIPSRLYEGFEIAKRMELSLFDAYIYQKKDNKWITLKKGGE